jgi:predicted RNA methylase
MCAGIGGLTFAARMRDYYHKDIRHSVCIERNPKFCEIDKRLVPKAEWICGDIFDKGIWDDIKSRYGKINCVLSNPPFGKVTKTDADRKYTGSEIDMAAIEVALTVCKGRIDFILPHGSVDWVTSGVPYYRRVDCRKTSKLKKDIGEFYMDGSDVDTTTYEFKGTNIRVECVGISRRR